MQVLAAAVHIERFDPSADEPRLRACYEIAAAAQPEDDPNAPPLSYSGFLAWWIYGMAGVPQQTWLATSDTGTPVGCYLLELPERENKGMAYRGHRLGLHVKVAMLEWLAEAEPQVRRVVTDNAVDNKHMIAVNDELGHRVTDQFQRFELDVAAARTLVAAR